jgi:hypothetical protein
VKNYLLALTALTAAAAAAPAHADIGLSSEAGNAVYQGPGFAADTIFDFEAATPRWNSAIFTTSDTNVRAQPLGSTGGFASVGPADGTPGVFDLTGLGPIATLSFLWGSIDTYNTLEVLGEGGAVLASFAGLQVWDPANGDQGSTATNRLVRLTFSGDSQAAVTGLRFNSTGNAFEFDNLAVAAVPEPATWAMMIGGFGLIGFASRRRARISVAYA